MRMRGRLLSICGIGLLATGGFRGHAGPESKRVASSGRRVDLPAPSTAPGLSVRRRFAAATLGIAIGLIAVVLAAVLGLLLASAIFGYGGLA